MTLALTAKEPHNYFLLLRALFRSIGGGTHDLLYQEFLPLLPDLLQGMNFSQFRRSVTIVVLNFLYHCKVLFGNVSFQLCDVMSPQYNLQPLVNRVAPRMRHYWCVIHFILVFSQCVAQVESMCSAHICEKFGRCSTPVSNNFGTSFQRT